MKISNRTLLTCALILVAMNGAWAHSYIANDGSHTDANNAIPMRDIDISQVVYHAVTPDTTTIWLRFDGTTGGVAKIQLGVPKIDGLEDYRPAFALLGPGMPSIDGLPFAVPDGYGGVVYTTDDVANPDIYDEEFTGTLSWRFDMQEIALPENGTYYIVGYVPDGNLGKFWIAPGTAEKFTLRDIITLPWIIYKVRTFHQVFPFGGIAGWAIVILSALIGGILLITQPFGLLSGIN